MIEAVRAEVSKHEWLQLLQVRSPLRPSIHQGGRGSEI